jgi:multiple antibiotic resistance protein
MLDCIKFFLRYFTTLFLAIGPFAIIALFVSMTAPFKHEERIRTAKISSCVAYGTMLFFALTGRKIFEFLGITVGAFYVAGGIIIFVVGLAMLRSEDSDEAASSVKQQNAQQADIAITPFGIPIICGPCAITTTIALQNQACGFGQWVAGLLAVSFVLALLYLCLIGSAHGAKWLTPMVLKLSYRLSGLILAAVAVQMVISGLRNEELGVIKPLQNQAIVKSIQCK